MTVARAASATIRAQFGELQLTGEDAPLWVVKGERLKGSERTPDYRTPLSPAALEVLALVPPGEPDDFIFKGGKPDTGLSNMAMLQLLKGMQPGNGLHSSRYEDHVYAWADNNGVAELIRERAIQHKNKDKVVRLTAATSCWSRAVTS